MSSIKSQIIGLLLAFATAVGCIFYEKIVKNFSYLTMVTIILIETALLLIVAYFFFPNSVKEDYQKIVSDSKYIWWFGAYILTGCTSLCWYLITRNQGVMVGSVYEFKYIVMLAIMYLFFGAERFTINTAIGVAMAMVSVYFISKK